MDVPSTGLDGSTGLAKRHTHRVLGDLAQAVEQPPISHRQPVRRPRQLSDEGGC